MLKLKKYLYETIKYALRSYYIIRPYIHQVEKLYTMSYEELNKRNNILFLKIFQEAYNKSPFYKRLYTSAGIQLEEITSIADIKKLPIVTKEMVKQYADQILIAPKWSVIKAKTSGTTGSPLKIYESWHSIWMSQAYLYYSRKKCGFTYGQPLVSLRGHLDKRITSLKIHINNTLYLSSYNINKEKVLFYYNKIKKFNPKAIEGYPSSLYSLAIFLRDLDLKLHIPITFTSSETLLDFQRKVIEEQLCTEIFDLYGMTEQTICLMEMNNHKGYYEMPGYSINEYLADGEICTSLINKKFPLIRYRSFDIIELLEDSSHLIKRIEGRKEDYIYCKDGSLIKRLGFLFKNVNHVRLSQLIQEKDGTLSICIVPELGFGDIEKKQITQNLINRVGNNNLIFRIKLISEKDIQYTKRGKFKYIINLNNE